MALHLNLLHEIDSAKRARQRDPLKLGLYGLVALILLFLGYYALRIGATSSVAGERKALATEWAQLEPLQKEAATKSTELQSKIALSENMVKYIETRFYWAPLLERIGEIVPPSVQITRLSADLLNARECTISIEGTAAGEEPRTVAEDLRTALASKLITDGGTVDAVFVSLEDGTAQAEVDGMARPTASFTIRLSVALPEQTVAAPN